MTTIYCNKNSGRKKINEYPDGFAYYPLFPLFLLDSYSINQIVKNRILHHSKASNKIVKKVENNKLDMQKTKAMHGQKKKNHVDSTVFLSRF